MPWESRQSLVVTRVVTLSMEIHCEHIWLGLTVLQKKHKFSANTKDDPTPSPNEITLTNDIDTALGDDESDETTFIGNAITGLIKAANDDDNMTI